MICAGLQAKKGAEVPNDLHEGCLCPLKEAGFSIPHLSESTFLVSPYYRFTSMDVESINKYHIRFVKLHPCRGNRLSEITLHFVFDSCTKAPDEQYG